MGLDVSFLTFASRDEVASLRKHQLFREMVFNRETPPIWSGHTDFLVHPDMVEAVATWPEPDESEVGQAEAAMSGTDFGRQIGGAAPRQRLFPVGCMDLVMAAETWPPPGLRAWQGDRSWL